MKVAEGHDVRIPLPADMHAMFLHEMRDWTPRRGWVVAAASARLVWSMLFQPPRVQHRDLEQGAPLV